MKETLLKLIAILENSSAASGIDKQALEDLKAEITPAAKTEIAAPAAPKKVAGKKDK